MKRVLADASLTAKGIVVVAIPVCALMASLFVFLQFQREARTAQQWVDHTYQVRSELRQISLLMVNAEAAARGYLLTGDVAQLERYSAAREQVPEHLAALRNLMRDNPPRIRQLDAIAAQVAATVQAFGALGEDAGASAGAEMDRLRAQLDVLEAAEGRLLEVRTAALNLAQVRLEFAILAGGVLGLAGGLLSAMIFTTRISRRVRRLGEDARRMAGGEPIVEETGSRDEIAQLGHTLQQTSELLSTQTAQLRAAHEDLEARVWRRTAELVEANQQLQRVNEIRQAVVGSSPLAIWAVDLEGKVRFWNPAAERIFGWTEEEVQHFPIEE